MILPKLLFFVMLLLVGDILAKENNTNDLKLAQETLSTGDYEHAYVLYKRIADKDNDPLASFTLGLFHQNGWGRIEDQKAACIWFGKAAQGRIPYGQHLYAECFKQGIHTKSAPLKAAYWYEQAIEGGYFLSYCYLAKLYMSGNGVERNPLRALQLCHKGVSGSPSAMVMMGRFYLEGDNSIRDNEQAFQWLLQAAQYNLPEANFYLGKMFELGLIKDKTVNDALYSYEQAASKGYVPAYFRTGRLYFTRPADPKTGYLSDKDLAKAYLWLSATKSQSTNLDELTEADKILRKILAVMPKNWLPVLNNKLEQQLSRVAVIH